LLENVYGRQRCVNDTFVDTNYNRRARFSLGPESHRRVNSRTKNPVQSGRHPTPTTVTRLTVPIEPHHVRRGDEMTFSAWKVAMWQSKMLRTQSPEMIRQQIWGMPFNRFIARMPMFRCAEEVGIVSPGISYTGAFASCMPVYRTRRKAFGWGSSGSRT